MQIDVTKMVVGGPLGSAHMQMQSICGETGHLLWGGRGLEGATGGQQGQREGGRQLWWEPRLQAEARAKAQFPDAGVKPVPESRGRKAYSCKNLHELGL